MEILLNTNCYNMAKTRMKTIHEKSAVRYLEIILDSSRMSQFNCISSVAAFGLSHTYKMDYFQLLAHFIS